MPSQVLRRGVQAARFSPRKLSPLAWYDVHLAGASAATVLDRMGGTAATLGSTGGSDANDPMWLPWTGTDYLYKPTVGGGNGNIYSVNATALASGDRTVRVLLALDNWADSNNWWAGSSANGETFTPRTINATVLRHYWKNSGGTTISRDVTVTNLSTLAAGGALWVESALDVDDGAGNHVVVVRTSSDGVTWTERGRTTTAGVTTQVPTSTLFVQIGGGDGYTMMGKVYAGQLIAGFQGGTVEVDFNAANFAAGSSTSYVDSVGSKGGTWSLTSRATSGRKTVLVKGRGVLLLGTDDYLAIPASSIPALTSGAAASIVVVGRAWATPPSNARWFSTEPAAGTNGVQIRHNSTAASLVGVVNDGTNNAATAATSYTPGQIVVATALVNGQNVSGLQIYVNNTAGIAVSTTTVGDRTVAAGGSVGRAGAVAASYADIEFFAWLSRASLFSPAEIGQLVGYYGGGT